VALAIFGMIRDSIAARHHLTVMRAAPKLGKDYADFSLGDSAILYRDVVVLSRTILQSNIGSILIWLGCHVNVYEAAG
jgi:hypothetical protein